MDIIFIIIYNDNYFKKSMKVQLKKNEVVIIQIDNMWCKLVI